MSNWIDVKHIVLSLTLSVPSCAQPGNFDVDRSVTVIIMIGYVSLQG